MARTAPASILGLIACLILAGTCSVGAAEGAGSPTTAYVETLKPLLRDRCFSCHGALERKAGLRVDSVELLRRGGKSGPALVPGKPDESRILKRVAETDPADRMPPEHEGQAFSSAQVDLLRSWIAAGAPAPAGETPESDPKDHWSFRPRVRPAVPPPAEIDPARVRNPIDAFLARELRKEGLSPLPEAPREVLVRRLFLDLVGIPPASGELGPLLSDPRTDWYERLVDRLLDDPRHGERWARHWMDIWRYSDGWGLGDQHRNSQKHIWHWRDWIVESLNADLPYDEMIRLMLAADESHPNDLSRLRATGFLVRNYFLFNRNQWLDETVEHVSKGFLGLTMNCAKCHDHKYDPFPQLDYYRLRAFFEPYHARLDVVPGESDLAKDGLPRAFDRQLDAPTFRFIRGNENAPDKSVAVAPGVPALLNFGTLEIHPVPLPPEAAQPERRPWVFEAYIDAARSKVAGARAKHAATSSSSASAPEREVDRLQLAVAEAELASVEARTAAQRARWQGSGQDSEPRRAAVRAERQVNLAKARLAVGDGELRLARAAADRKEALTKELAAARTKADEAGRQADAPVQDTDTFTPLTGATWTATRFFDSTKDDPAVEFPSTSTGRRTALAAWITDPRHPLTARVAANHVWNRHFGTPLVPAVFDFGRKSGTPIHADLVDWLASELVDHGWSLKHLHRVIVLSATYRRDSSLANPESRDNLARDPDNRYWWRRLPLRLEAQVVRDSLLAHAGRLDARLGGPPVAAADQDASLRRSLYFYHSNNDRNLFLATFDDALVKECYRREQSIVPQQALALLNGRLVHDQIPRIAGSLPGTETSAGSDDAAFVGQAFRRLLGFAPGRDELDASLQSLAAWRMDSPEAARRARENFVWALINHGDFVTLR